MEIQNCSLNTARSVKPMDANFISKVRVIVRVRPFLPREIAAKNGTPSSCTSVTDQDAESRDEVTVLLKDPDTSRKECYQLDSFFGQEDNSVSRIFEREVNPFIPGIFQGYNATVFAYGATGSGKTYTMQGTDQFPGLMPLAMSTILNMCQSRGSKVEISYYEVYMDRCFDLLELKGKEIAILDDKDGQTHLRGLSKVPVSSMSEFQEVFSRGTRRRKIAHTGLNDVSSRSHGVLVIGVFTSCSDGVLAGKLNLIDLAGNEDNRRTYNEGIRLLESSKINQSLFALSNVIHALNNNKPRVPYRECKLTRILQDSLGGASRALMIACLNPGEYQESVHTVSLAARSRHILNVVPSPIKLETPKVKIDRKAELQAWLESRGKIKSAQRLRAQGSPFPASSIKKPNYGSHVKAKVISNWNTSNAKESVNSVPFRSLLHTEGSNDPLLESLQSVVMDNREDISADSAENVLELTTQNPVEPLAKEQKITFVDSNNSMEASPFSEKKNAVGSSLRKVLSPINSNINQFPNEEVPADQKCVGFFEPKSPITPFTTTPAKGKFTTTGTPLDKFSLTSATLKNSLMQEYIEFLNTASREELLQIKGIGLKMAEYIVELRETSPLKSLKDLENLGLSSKQVHNMFSKAARGIFDMPEVLTPSWSETLKVE